jgi:hypothetical protein
VENFRVIGPYFFEDEDGRAITVTSTRYVAMLWSFLTPELSRRGIELSTIWFREDGATTNEERASEEVVREIFRSRLIQYTESFRGLHVRLISLPVIISFGNTSER